MKIKQIGLIISLIALSFEINLRQSDASTLTNDTDNTTDIQSPSQINKSVNEPSIPQNKSEIIDSPNVKPQSSVANNQTQAKIVENNNTTAQKPYYNGHVKHESGNDMIIRPPAQTEVYRPTPMVSSTPVCATPAPVPAPMLTPTPAIVRPYARIMPEPLRVFVPENRLMGPPISQPSPLVSANTYPIHTVAPLPINPPIQSIPVATPISTVAQSATAVAQSGIGVVQAGTAAASNTTINPNSEKDLKITVNKKKKGKIELTISAQPKGNNI
jgi:hypothetical protein